MKKYNLFLFFLLSKITFACQCPPIKTISKEICKNYDAIFAGTVDSVSACLSKGAGKAYFFINELYKGRVQQHLNVDFDCSSACMMSFSKNEEWLIYATYTRFDLLTVNLCGHSRKYFKDVSEDFYQIAAERTFEQEKQFLKTTSGIQPFAHDKELTQQQADLKLHNEQPNGINKIGLLLISFAAMAIVYFVTKNKK